MSKFVRNDNSLYNGISQQAVELRLPNQVADAVNTKLSVSYGLERRPPAEPILRKVDEELNIDTLVHSINRDENERYLMAWSNTGNSTVFDLEGNELPIIYASQAVQDYVETISPDTGVYTPSLDLKLTTVLDNTLLVNKNVVTSMDGSTSTDPLPNHVYVWIKNGVVQVERVLTIDGALTLTAPKGTLNDTEVIVDEFISGFAGEVDYIATKISKSVLRIERVDAVLPVVEATDTYGDSTMSTANTTGAQFEDLPPKATDGAVIRIESDEATETVHYLKFNASKNAWFETTAPSEAIGLLTVDMPKTVVRRQDDGVGTVTGTPNQLYFSVESITWSTKETGGVAEAPNPSFIGNTISDVFFYKNRLGFLSGENVILSKIDDLFNFFPTSVKEVLDDDPVDISVSSNTALNLIQVATFPDSLVLFGTNKQFTLHSDGKPFTALNITVDPTTAYNANPEADPVSVGSSLFFNAPVGRYSSVREYAITPDTLVADAVDVTGHVPRFLPSNIKQILAEPNLEYLFLFDKNEADSDCKNNLWVYKFFWQGNEKVQSAWFKWEFWCNPIGGGLFGGDLVILAQDEGDTVLVKLNLEAQPEEILRSGTDIPFKVTSPLIDNRTLVEDTAVTFSPTETTVQVDLELYGQHGLDCATSVLVDRWTGEAYVYSRKFESAGDYFLVFSGVSSGVETPFTSDDRVLGTYTIGVNEINTGA